MRFMARPYGSDRVILLRKINMKTKLTMIAAATIAASSVSANEVRFTQSSQGAAGTASIAIFDINQSTGQANFIGRNSLDKSNVTGGLATLVINQTGDANKADIDVFTADDGVGTINLAFTGDSNDFDLTYGAAADATWSTLDVDVVVTGNSNTFVEAIAQTTTSLVYDAVVTGDTNAIDTTSGSGVTTMDIDYDIYGGNNYLTVDTGTLGGARDLDVDITGSSNDWTVNAKSTTSSTVDVLQTAGANVTGVISQQGTNSTMDLDIAASLAGSFALTTVDMSAGSSATINLTTLGAGEFDLTQNTDASIYDVSMTLAAGADIDVSM